MWAVFRRWGKVTGGGHHDLEGKIQASGIRLGFKVILHLGVSPPKFLRNPPGDQEDVQMIGVEAGRNKHPRRLY